MAAAQPRSGACRPCVPPDGTQALADQKTGPDGTGPAWTDPGFVNLCLDTGHVSYGEGDNLAIINRHPERIGYLHLKQVNPEIVARVHAENLPFSEAVKLGAMTEPPLGVPEFPPLLEAVERTGADVFGIVEQDMYPCPPDAPLPIAQRTRSYLGGCGIHSLQLAAEGRRTASDAR